ncbi:MarR family winged helix-turn-helix transcriptional regulator [Collinsella intestinalis]|uniref:MarR family winged helix-turn-helix transcriptional regulator n=1 Tax=Collinsella intestinalis TaxID=147207 RepID=UPI00195AFEB0|nr:winged helix DNA-binding protein [Collinsella intestinalis]MBM6943245.1 winged helix DNA-binding protein [Collinsella intestinalis]
MTADACSRDGGSARELDYLYNEIDKLYHVYAHGCGVSDCAYWMLYDLEVAGGELPLAELTGSWSYSKQTINSALKTLAERGLVELSFVPGSRKSKRARLTEAGQVFSRRHILPAIRAEERAFSFLSPAEQEELIRLVRRYTEALDAQLTAVEAADAGPGSGAEPPAGPGRGPGAGPDCPVDPGRAVPAPDRGRPTHSPYPVDQKEDCA